MAQQVLNLLQVGKPAGQNAFGTTPPMRAGGGADAIVSELLPRYGRLTADGQVFSVTFAAAALAVVSGTAAGAFLLANPLNSGVAAILIDCMPGITAFTATTGGCSVILGGLGNAVLTSLGTAVVPNSTLVGSSITPQLRAYPSGTIAQTPVPIRALTNLYVDLAAGDIAALKDEISGAVIILPGSAVNIYGLGGTPADITLQPTFTWAEVAWPLP